MLIFDGILQQSGPWLWWWGYVMGSHKMQTNEHRGFLLKALNARRNCDEIVRPIVMPFILHHHLLLQHNNAWLHVAMICAQLLDAEIIPVLTWPAYSPGMSPVDHV